MKKPITALLVVLVLCGCQQKVDLAKVVVADDYIKSSLSYRKQGALVALNNDQVNLEAAGVQYAIDLSMLSGYDSGKMTVSITPSKGLYILDGNQHTTRPLVKGKIKLPYIVSASQEGRYYLYANVSIEHGGKNTARALTLIVQVGETATRKTQLAIDESEVNRKQDGSVNETIILLPATEEIIQ
ncbi:hypothetical protein CBF23_012915 [Marinomonas agarivorans]|nr:hypothetical protein CBF23_012915 [Marinomonas agarivorans]